MIISKRYVQYAYNCTCPTPWMSAATKISCECSDANCGATETNTCKYVRIWIDCHRRASKDMNWLSQRTLKQTHILPWKYVTYPVNIIFSDPPSVLSIKIRIVIFATQSFQNTHFLHAAIQQTKLSNINPISCWFPVAILLKEVSNLFHRHINTEWCYESAFAFEYTQCLAAIAQHWIEHLFCICHCSFYYGMLVTSSIDSTRVYQWEISWCGILTNGFYINILQINVLEPI